MDNHQYDYHTNDALKVMSLWQQVNKIRGYTGTEDKIIIASSMKSDAERLKEISGERLEIQRKQSASGTEPQQTADFEKKESAN